MRNIFNAFKGIYTLTALDWVGNRIEFITDPMNELIMYYSGNILHCKGFVEQLINEGDRVSLVLLPNRVVHATLPNGQTFRYYGMFMDMPR